MHMYNSKWYLFFLKKIYVSIVYYGIKKTNKHGRDMKSMLVKFENRS